MNCFKFKYIYILVFTTWDSRESWRTPWPKHFFNCITTEWPVVGVVRGIDKLAVIQIKRSWLWFDVRRYSVTSRFGWRARRWYSGDKTTRKIYRRRKPLVHVHVVGDRAPKTSYINTSSDHAWSLVRAFPRSAIRGLNNTALVSQNFPKSIYTVVSSCTETRRGKRTRICMCVKPSNKKTLFASYGTNMFYTRSESACNMSSDLFLWYLLVFILELSSTVRRPKFHIGLRRIRLKHQIKTRTKKIELTFQQAYIRILYDSYRFINVYIFIYFMAFYLRFIPAVFLFYDDVLYCC